MRVRRRTFGFLAAVLVLLAGQALAGDLTPGRWGDFDEYVLALSWQPGFCQMQHDAHPAALPAECRNEPEQADRAAYLTLHGLWPGLPHSLAVPAKAWRNLGCAAVDPAAYPAPREDDKCAAARLPLSAETEREMAVSMPGANKESCLAQYEYAKHGVCFGFEPNTYFQTAMRLDRELTHGPFGAFLRENYGKTVTRAAFLRALAAQLGGDAAGRVTLSCRENAGGAYLTEIRFSVRRAAVNAPFSADSLGGAMPRGNCGTFVLDRRGF